MASIAKHVVKASGVTGFSRGVVAHIGVAAWALFALVGFGDLVKESFGTK